LVGWWSSIRGQQNLVTGQRGKWEKLRKKPQTKKRVVKRHLWNTFGFWSTTAYPTWQAIGTPKSSSLAEDRQEFLHLYTTAFEGPFCGPSVPEGAIPVSHHT
jgi:hypothetical protein